MLILVGPSASGKTQILQVLIKEYGMEKLVTYTTRKMRANEVEGRDYHFISLEEFQRKIKNNFFFEYVLYNGNYYGTAKNDLADHKAVILEPQGLQKYLDEARDKVTVLVIRCSKEILRIRMLNRGDDIETIKARLISDSVIFSKDLYTKADYVIDSSASNIYSDAKTIYQYYQKALRNK